MFVAGILGYLTAALIVGARRSADRSLRRSILLLGLALATLVFSIVVTSFLTSGTLPYVIVNQGTGLVGIYLIYRSVMSLTPLGRVEKNVVADFRLGSPCRRCSIVWRASARMIHSLSGLAAPPQRLYSRSTSNPSNRLSQEQRRLAAIMFTDMVGYTALTQSNEPLALSLLRTQDGMILPLVRAHGGTPIKTIGDAHLAEFESALEAVLCAVEIQRKVKEHHESSPGERFNLRIGIHVGDVVHRNNDVFGDAVNIAARLEPLADPGGVCISQQVYDQVQNKVGVRLEKLPFHQLKNVAARIDAYRVIDVQPAAPVQAGDMPKDRVAVLPLANFSPSPQDEYLAEGMTEELITAVSKVRGLRVIARTSVMKFKNTESDIAEIGKALNVGTILEGSFRKIGEKIRVTVQLIDAGTEEHRWASNYDGDMSDIFTIQSDIAGKVAQALQTELVAKTPAQQKTVNLEAYELYLKGRHYWNLRTEEGIKRALELFKGAAEKDPSFAKAHAGMADCYTVGKGYSLFSREESDRLAAASVQKALELDSTLPEAHASRGLLLQNQFKFAEAEESFKQALAFNPSYASAHHWYAITLANLGRLEEAIGEAKLAAQSDPLSPPANNILGVMYLYARDYDQAEKVFDRVLVFEPAFTMALLWRSNVFAYKQMEAESMKDMLQAVQTVPAFDRNSMLAYNNAWFGHKDEALKCFEEAKKNLPFQEGLAALSAGYYACLGDADGFFAWVRKAIDAKDIEPQIILYAPYLDKMRADPRYAELLLAFPSQ